MELDTALETLSWIPRPRLTALRRLRIETVGDLLTHYPRRHENRTESGGFPSDETPGPVCLCGEVTKTRLMRFGPRKIFEAVLEEESAHALSQPLTCRWFNLHYVQKMIATGQRLVIFGKVKRKGARLIIDHPEFEVIENDEEISIHFRRITPVYPATEGLSQRVLRALIFRVLQETASESSDVPLPFALNNVEHGDALRQIHFPETEQELGAVREHLVLGEFFRMQMQVVWQHEHNAMRLGQRHAGRGELLDDFLAELPFRFTEAQKRVLKEIRRDLERGSPMNRLLQGDVGSGKTAVAIAAMLLVVEGSGPDGHGAQAALMAPTQILAEQHYAVLCRWLEPLGVRVALRTGAREEDNAPPPLFANVSAPVEPDATRDPGSARVPRAGDGVPPSRTFPEREPSFCARYSERRLPHFEKPWAIYAVTIETRLRRCLSPEARGIVLDALQYFHNKRYELFAACVMPDHVHFLIQPWPKDAPRDEKEIVFWPLSELLHSIKSFFSHAINKAKGKQGAVWEKERFDRYVRSDRDLVEKFQYIVRNPWDAGVVKASEDYPWIWTQEDGAHKESPPRRDAATSTREACATRMRGGTVEAEIVPVLPDDAPQIIVGTHALLYEGVPFSRLGLAVIDEQHKFGVSQRARLTAREPAPDVLVMTATPIPRTLTMTIYGDLNVSTIDEMPGGRGEIYTRVMNASEIGEAANFLRAQLACGRQAYIVYPLIDESEKLQAKAAAAEFDRWQEGLKPFRCELLHGRIAAPEKQAIMQRFRAGETQALVSTTVIEVGVDVPNATVMLIENAERFGLSQLHQLRGRIGRGGHVSHCLLLTSDKSPETLAKLRVLEKTANGFEIAEADWDLRGPGDLLGTAQSGLPEFKLGDLKRDAALMRKARAAAIKLLQDDPDLEQPENQRFRSLIVERQEEIFSQVS
jgi:RecG-like helicase/REP element-mobilizing transposase RayT